MVWLTLAAGLGSGPVRSRLRWAHALADARVRIATQRVVFMGRVSAASRMPLRSQRKHSRPPTEAFVRGIVPSQRRTDAVVWHHRFGCRASGVFPIHPS